MDYRLDQRLLVMRRRDLRHIHQQRSYRYFAHGIGLIDEKKADVRQPAKSVQSIQIEERVGCYHIK